MADNVWIDAARILQPANGRPANVIEDEVVELFGELRVPLLRYLHTMGLPPGDGEDVAQDAFIALFRHLRDGKPRDNLRAWIFRVARNLALKRIQQNTAGLPDDCISGDANPEQQAALNQQQRAARAVVNALAPLDRQCLLLRAEGLRYREIAAVLDISLGSVAASLSRTLGKIARATQSEK